MVTMGVFPFQGKTQMVETGIEPGTSWLVVRSSDHQATRLVVITNIYNKKTEGPTLMELFIATGKLEKFSFFDN